MSSGFEHHTDGELARRCQAGALAAFEELVYRYEGRLYRYITQACGNGADAREITQDTFVRAFQAITQFDSTRAIGPWLFTIARRKCIDHLRTRPTVPSEPVPELQDPDTPAENLARREDRQNLWHLARRRLPDLQFQALWLKYAEDMTLAEIARVVGKTQTHVKVLLFRARLALGQELHSLNRANQSPPPTHPENRQAGSSPGDAVWLPRHPAVTSPQKGAL